MAVPETIQHLRRARASHKSMIMRAEATLAGMPIDPELQKPLTATACDFGQWLDGTGKRLQGFSVFNQLQTYHESFHHEYAEIFKILFDKPKGIKNIFGQSKKAKKSLHLEAELLLPRLQSNYDALVKLLSTLEKDYLALKERSKTKGQAKEQLEEQTKQDLHTKSFRDVSKMMETLEKDVDSWLE